MDRKAIIFNNYHNTLYKYLIAARKVRKLYLSDNPDYFAAIKERDRLYNMKVRWYNLLKNKL